MLSFAIGEASGLNGVPGRAFQARDRWGHIGATSGPRTTGPQWTTTVIAGPSSAQLAGQAEADVAGRRDPRQVSDTEEDAGSPRRCGIPRSGWSRSASRLPCGLRDRECCRGASGSTPRTSPRFPLGPRRSRPVRRRLRRAAHGACLGAKAPAFSRYAPDVRFDGDHHTALWPGESRPFTAARAVK
jgi:hypothetical protein